MNMLLLHKPCKSISAQARGFTLIEILVVVAIIGIIAAVAWPAYQDQLRSMRRKEGVNVILKASHEMGQCKTDSGNYIKPDGTDCAPTTVNSARGLYSVTSQVTNAGEGYTLTATKNINDDAECQTLTINQLGQKGYTGTAPDYHRCWSD